MPAYNSGSSPLPSSSPPRRSDDDRGYRHAASSPGQSGERRSSYKDQRQVRSSPSRARQGSQRRSLEDEQAAEIHSLQEQITALKALVPKERKRKRNDDEEDWARVGRGIPRVATVYEDVATMISQSDKCRANKYHIPPDSDDDDDEEDEDVLEEKRVLQRSYMGMEALKKLIPNLKKVLSGSGNQKMLFRELQRGADSARSYDTSQVKAVVIRELNYIVDSMNEDRMMVVREAQKAKRHAERACKSHTGDGPMPVIPDVPELDLELHFNPNSPEERGLQNDLTGLLLCPAEFDWDDEATRTAVRNTEAEYDFASSAHARCFYMDGDVNPDDLDENFLQSHLLLQVFRVIYTSPSSTKNQSFNSENIPPTKKQKSNKSTRGDVAQIVGMTSVTPRAIAYAAVHLHLALSDATQWSASHNGYNYQSLWNYIVDFFEAPANDKDEKRGKNLLKWWTDRIFTGTRSAANNRGTIMASRNKVVARRQAEPVLSPNQNHTNTPDAGAASTSTSL